MVRSSYHADRQYEGKALTQTCSVKRLSSLNLLRTFESAARLQSFKLAAEELHITSSAVSQQIRDLESQLDVKLFDRQGQGLVLSEAGRHYWQRY